MREINLLKQKGTAYVDFPPPRQRQSSSLFIVMAVGLLLLIGGIAYFFLTVHLPLRQDITELRIELARSRKIIVNQEHSLNDLSKKLSQYETTTTQPKQPLETPPPAKPEKQPIEAQPAPKPQEKEEPEIEEVGKMEEKPKPVASPGRPHPYVLHVASFQGPKASLSDLNRWQKRGYTPFVVLTQVPNKGYWYRIYLNRFESLNQATSLALKLKKEKLVDSAIPMKLPYALETSESGEGIWQRLKRKSYSPYSLVPGKILVGAYAAKHEAEEASRRLAAEGFPNRIVKP